MTTQSLYWIHVSPTFSATRRQSITVPGTQTSVCSLQKIPGVAQKSLFASALTPLAGVPATVPKSWATVRHDHPPHHLHLVYACVNFQLVNLGVRDARAFEIPRVWPSSVSGARGFRIINRTCLTRGHRRSRRWTANLVKRIHLPSFSRARAVRVRARHQEAATTA